MSVLLTPGANPGVAPVAGQIGEELVFDLAAGSATSITSITAKTIISGAFTAGVWDLDGFVFYLPDATTSFQYYEVSVGATTNTRNTAFGFLSAGFVTGAGQVPGSSGFVQRLPAPARITLTSTTTYYLIAYAQFGVSTLTAAGRLRGVRVA